MKLGQSIPIPACSAVLFLAIVLPAGAGDSASFLSATIPTNTVMAPGQVFTQTWTLQNTGANSWSPGQSGYTLNLAATDSLGAVPLAAVTSGAAYPPCATINSGSTVGPGATATFSMYFIAPETAGTYSDSLQMANASAGSFGPKVGVQIIVQQAGPSGQYDRARAVSYANNYAAYICSDGYFWTNGSGFTNAGTATLTPVPKVEGDDCAHFVSCCIGSEPHQKGGGLSIATRDVTYGEPGAARLIQTNLLWGGLGVEVSSLSSLSPGDVIAWNWEGETNLADIDHDTIYLGNGLLAAHSASHLDASATTWYQDQYSKWEWHLIHLLNKADTIPPTVAISSPTNGQTFTSSTLAVVGAANDAGCPSSGVSLVQAQVNGTGGTWQTASGTTNWSASASLNPGANTIYVRSRDGAGNYSTMAAVTVTLLSTQPVIQFVYPPVINELAGDHVAFQVSASGAGTLLYQWYQTNSLLAGQTNTTLVLTNIQPANSGTYQVSVVDSTGIYVTNSVTLNVLTNHLPLYPTNLVVLRVGDGAQALSGGAGNTIYLDQYTTAGVYVSSLMVPDESVGAPYRAGSSASVSGSPALLLPGAGNDYSFSGMLTLSANQQFLTFAAYCADYPFGGADLTVGTTGGAYWRGLATVSAAGYYSLAYTNTGLYSGGNHSIRSAVTLDGTNFWTAGQAGSAGVKYVDMQNAVYGDGSGIPDISTASAAGTRMVQVVGTNLIYSDAAASGGSGLYLCSGTPELAPNGSTTATLLLAEGGQPNDFAISPDGRTIYIADSRTFTNATTPGGGIQRWDTNSAGGGYGFSYTLPAYLVSGAQGLTVSFPTNIAAWGSNVLGATLFATSPSNVLSRVVDNGPASAATVLVTAAPCNELLRGVRFAPLLGLQTAPLMAWATPAAIPYGMALSSNQLNATASVPGGFAYTPTNGTVLNAATSTLAVLFTPTDTVDYSTVTDTVSLVVLRAALTVTTANASRQVGAANPLFTGLITGLTNGDNLTASYSCSATTDSPAGTYAITPTLADPGNRLGNYQVTLINGTLTVFAPPVIQSARQSAHALTFSWSAVTNQRYQVQSATNLASANWTLLGGTITATNSTMTISEPVGANRQQYYRLVLLP